MFIQTHEGERMTVENNESCEINFSWFYSLGHSYALAQSLHTLDNERLLKNEEP